MEKCGAIQFTVLGCDLMLPTLMCFDMIFYDMIRMQYDVLKYFTFIASGISGPMKFKDSDLRGRESLHGCGFSPV